MPDWKNAPEGGNWGRFGADDELGTLNYIGAAERKAAAAEIREGLAFCLSLPLDIPGAVSLHPRRKAPRLQPTYLGDTPYINYRLDRVEAGLQDVLSDDQVLMSMQYSTQWDSLAHVGAMFDVDGDGVAEPVYYNGFRAGQHILGATEGSPHGSYAKRLSVAPMAATGVQGRGVLVDLLAAFGPGRTVIGLDLLQQAMRDQDVSIRPGDILMLRTGFAEALWDMQDAPDPEGLSRFGAVLDGSDPALLDWVGNSRIAAIATDNEAVEEMQKASGDSCFRLPLHHHCLFRLGLPLAELWYFRDLAAALAARKRNAAFLTAPPFRLPGAIGSPVTPVATI